MIMKNKKLMISLISTISLFCVFVLFTLLVKFVDVAYVGFTGKEIGLSSLNKLFYESVSVSELFDKLSDAIMIVSVIIAMFIAILGIVQLVKNKNLKAVDKEIYSFAIVLVMLVIVYVLFEIVDLNFRPILIEGKVEASYPSSHTMLALTVFMCASYYGFSKLTTKRNRAICLSVAVILIVVTILFRVLSGMHWITDIIASIILSLMLTSIYILTINIFQKMVNKNGKQG